METKVELRADAEEFPVVVISHLCKLCKGFLAIPLFKAYGFLPRIIHLKAMEQRNRSIRLEDKDAVPSACSEERVGATDQVADHGVEGLCLKSPKPCASNMQRKPEG